MNRARLRDLGLVIGDLPAGKHNAITDVPDVWVGHKTLVYNEPRVARTGVTMIVPRANRIWEDYAFAAWHSFNGNGEMTGIPWLEESGMLGSPIGLTNTHQVGVVRDALIHYSSEQGFLDTFMLPVVAETYDGWLNDINAFHVTAEHALAALESAASGSVDEGDVGGGTGMICHGFKGGIGTSSRVLELEAGRFTVGVLVQANYGRRKDLRISGVPVGETLVGEWGSEPYDHPKTDGSIIVVIATDAPLLPVQCKRLAQRATVGLARVGGVGYNGSGDIFLAFATGNHLAASGAALQSLQMIPHKGLDPFFRAVADATEESILNALCAADTMTGFAGHVVYALPLERVQLLLNA